MGQNNLTTSRDATSNKFTVTIQEEASSIFLVSFSTSTSQMATPSPLTYGIAEPHECSRQGVGFQCSTWILSKMPTRWTLEGWCGRCSPGPLLPVPPAQGSCNSKQCQQFCIVQVSAERSITCAIMELLTKVSMPKMQHCTNQNLSQAFVSAAWMLKIRAKSRGPRPITLTPAWPVIALPLPNFPTFRSPIRSSKWFATILPPPPMRTLTSMVVVMMPTCSCLLFVSAKEMPWETWY